MNKYPRKMKDLRFMFLFLFISLLSHTKSTYCPRYTNRFCKSTDHTISRCTRSHCACIKGYVHSDSGCIEAVLPTLKIEDPPGASGDGVIGGDNIILKCEPQANHYIWYRNQEQIKHTAQMYTIHISSMTRLGTHGFTCRISDNGFMSKRSASVYVSIYAKATLLQSQPIITGVPEVALDKQKIKLQCTNLPTLFTQKGTKQKGKQSGDLLIQWKKKGVKKKVGTGPTLEIDFNSRAIGNEYTCLVSSKSRKYNLSQPASPPVTLPLFARPAIRKVGIVGSTGKIEITEGFGLYLECDVVDTGVERHPQEVHFKWISGKRTFAGSNYVKDPVTLSDNGLLTCKADIAKHSVNTSVQIIVLPSGGIPRSKLITVHGEVDQPLCFSHFSLQCVIAAPDPLEYIYVWKHNGHVVFNHNERFIQFQPAIEGNFTCSAKKHDVMTPWSQAKRVRLIQPGDKLKVNLSSDADNGLYAENSKHTFTCGLPERSYTPGLYYEWRKNGKKIKLHKRQFTTVIPANESTSIRCSISFHNRTFTTNLTIDKKSVKKIVKATIYLQDYAKAKVEIAAINASKSQHIRVFCDLKMSHIVSKKEVSVEFRYDGIVIPVDKSADTKKGLTISRKTSGSLTCVGIHQSGERTHSNNSINITVRESPFSVSIHHSNSMSLIVDEEHLFYCLPTSYYENCSYTWSLNSDIISQNGPVLQHTFGRLTLPGNDEKLFCKVKCGKKSGTHVITLHVQDNGRKCIFASDCVGPGFTGQCLGNICMCKIGYRKGHHNCILSKNSATRKKICHLLTILIIYYTTNSISSNTS